MSVLVSVAPSVSPVVEAVAPVVKTVVVNAGSHWFQLAEIVKYLALGSGLSVIHSVVNGQLGLPKWLNKVLPVVYAALGGLAIVVVDNSVNWSDWFQVFVQVLGGAVGIYALVELVTVVKPSPSQSLPVVTQP